MLMLVAFIFTSSPSNSHSTERPGGGQEAQFNKAREAAAFGPANEKIAIFSDKLRTLVLSHNTQQHIITKRMWEPRMRRGGTGVI